MSRRGNRGGPATVLWILLVPLLTGCPRTVSSSSAASTPVGGTPPSVARLRVTVVDAEERPAPEGRLAILSRESFDAQGRLRPEALASCAERLSVIVEDPAAPAPPSVDLVLRSGGEPLSLPLSGPAARRQTPPFLLLSDRDDAAASPGAVFVPAGGRLDVRYRGTSVLDLKVGPSVIHEIPVRVVAAGVGLPPAGDFEKAIDLRLRQANAVWEPFGRRFVRGPVSRIEAPKGLVLIRGRAAGVDAQGHPSHSGLRVEGRDVLVSCPWRDDGAPLTPKAAARALIEKAGRSVRADLFDGLAGDREAVIVRWKRPDGSPAAVEKLPGSNDVAQGVEPLSVDLSDGIEVSPTGATLSLEETALLASGRPAPAEGIDLFVVAGLRSLQLRPAFKVYPEAQFPPLIASSAIVSWPVVDGTGRYPYALARALGELLLPLALRPAPDDTLFADPLSESAGVDAHKRLSAATGARISERGRALSGRK
ncbi:MAG TPA: hypothetical protein VKW04_10380 [Planctomycetota bacterium]|nr:hypothetical protein [Planctomycetota bacterium]